MNGHACVSACYLCGERTDGKNLPPGQAQTAQAYVVLTGQHVTITTPGTHANKHAEEKIHWGASVPDIGRGTTSIRSP